MKPILESIRKRKKLLLRSAVLGILLGVVCHFVPLEYRDACTAATRALSLTCTGVP